MLVVIGVTSVIELVTIIAVEEDPPSIIGPVVRFLKVSVISRDAHHYTRCVNLEVAVSAMKMI